MRLALSSRAQALLLLGLAAALGALLGIMGDRIISAQGSGPQERVMSGPPPRGGMPSALRYTEGLAARLDLTAEQRAQIDSILAEERVRAREVTRRFQPQFRAIAQETRARVEAVLTPEQRAQLDSLRDQRMRRLDADRPRRDGSGRAPRSR